MPPESIGNPECKLDEHLIVEKIIKYYKNHPSIETINTICNKKRILISLLQPQKK